MTAPIGYPKDSCTRTSNQKRARVFHSWARSFAGCVMSRVDRLLLNHVYQPIADLTWRYSGKTRFFLAWICFGVAFVGLCLDLYATLAKGGPFIAGAVLGIPIMSLILSYLRRASGSIDREAAWTGFDGVDRFIRGVTMSSALFFVFVDIVAYLTQGTLDMTKQTFPYVLYAFACSSALYFVEAKPPSAEATSSLRYLPARL